MAYVTVSHTRQHESYGEQHHHSNMLPKQPIRERNANPVAKAAATNLVKVEIDDGWNVDYREKGAAEIFVKKETDDGWNVEWEQRVDIHSSNELPAKPTPAAPNLPEEATVKIDVEDADHTPTSDDKPNLESRPLEIKPLSKFVPEVRAKNISGSFKAALNMQFGKAELTDEIKQLVSETVKFDPIELTNGKNSKGQASSEIWNDLLRKGFHKPMIIRNAAGLQMRLPDPDFTVYSVERALGKDHDLEVYDSSIQSHKKIKLGEFVEHMEQDPSERKEILNCISLEISETSLSHRILAPRFITEHLSWVDMWPKVSHKPKVSKYLLMSEKDAFTDFHIDFGGTSVWYHVHKGRKTFYLIPPTTKNLETYVKWTKKPDQIFLPDMLDPCQCIKRALSAGQTLIIPTGWIHAVITDEDSVVFGGNFLHSLHVNLQLRIESIEKELNLDEDRLFPYFHLTHWYAAPRTMSIVERFLNEKTTKPIPQHLVDNLNSHALHLYNLIGKCKDLDFDERQEYVPFGMDVKSLLNEMFSLLRKCYKRIPEGEDKYSVALLKDEDFAPIQPPGFIAEEKPKRSVTPKKRKSNPDRPPDEFITVKSIKIKKEPTEPDTNSETKPGVKPAKVRKTPSKSPSKASSTGTAEFKQRRMIKKKKNLPAKPLPQVGVNETDLKPPQEPDGHTTLPIKKRPVIKTDEVEITESGDLKGIKKEVKEGVKEGQEEEDQDDADEQSSDSETSIDSDDQEYRPAGSSSDTSIGSQEGDSSKRKKKIKQRASTRSLRSSKVTSPRVTKHKNKDELEEYQKLNLSSAIASKGYTRNMKQQMVMFFSFTPRPPVPPPHLPPHAPPRGLPSGLGPMRPYGPFGPVPPGVAHIPAFIVRPPFGNQLPSPSTPMDPSLCNTSLPRVPHPAGPLSHCAIRPVMTHPGTPMTCTTPEIKRTSTADTSQPSNQNETQPSSSGAPLQKAAQKSPGVPPEHARTNTNNTTSSNLKPESSTTASTVSQTNNGSSKVVAGNESVKKSPYHETPLIHSGDQRQQTMAS